MSHIKRDHIGKNIHLSILSSLFTTIDQQFLIFYVKLALLQFHEQNLWNQISHHSLDSLMKYFHASDLHESEKVETFGFLKFECDFKNRFDPIVLGKQHPK